MHSEESSALFCSRELGPRAKPPFSLLLGRKQRWEVDSFTCVNWMLKLVVCEISNPYGYSKVRNTSLRFLWSRLNWAPYCTKKENITERQWGRIKTNKTKAIKNKNEENTNSETTIPQLIAAREVVAKQHRVNDAKRPKKQTTSTRGRGRDGVKRTARIIHIQQEQLNLSILRALVPWCRARQRIIKKEAMTNIIV